MPTRREAMVLFGGVAALAGGPGGGWARTAARTRASADGLRRASPREVDVDPDAVIGYLDALSAAGLEIDSFMIYRKGAVAAEGWSWPYRPELYHMLHSATKSFVGAGIGIAIDEGLLSLDDPVLRFFPGRVTDPGPFLREMTIEHLLTQTSGHAIGISGSQWRPIRTSWVTEFLKVPVVYRPGTHFAYSSATSFMLSAIVTSLTGRPFSDYVAPRLLAPMGISNCRWDVGPERINPGGNGFSTTTADFLKLGVMLMEGGRWRGLQIVPSPWAAAIGMPRHGNDYGYQWWVAPEGLGYFAAGKFGQFCFVFPGHDAVMALTAGVPDNLATRKRMQQLAFEHIPAICGPSAAPAASQARLKRRLAASRVLPPLASGTSTLAERVSGRRYICTDNVDGVRTITLTFERDAAVFEMVDARGTHRVRNGLRDYVEADTTVTGSYLHHEYEPDVMRVVAGGRWTSNSVFEMTWQFVQSGFRDAVTMTFAGDVVRYDRRVNVNSGTLRRPTIIACSDVEKTRTD